MTPPTELSTKIKARIPSPSGLKLAVLVEENIPVSDADGASESKRYAFEIWTDHGHRLANRIILPSEKHGQVCTDFDWFGGISWSPDETALVYCAEINKPKTSSFFTRDAEQKVVGGQYTLGVGKSENWGEKYVRTALLALFCLNVKTGKIGVVENVPGSSLLNNPSSLDGGYVLGQPIFSPCGKSVVYTGWDAGEGDEMPRRLGAIYCFQRPCKIYSSTVSELLDRLSNAKNEGQDVPKIKNAPFVCITPGDRLARSPRFSKPSENTSKLAYLCNTKGFDTHGGCMALHVCDWDMSQGSVKGASKNIIVDVVHLPGEREGDNVEVAGIKFPGLFLNQLPEQCFSPDGKCILATSEWGSVTRVVSISLNDGSVTPINFDLKGVDCAITTSSQRFVCFSEDGGAIVTQSEAHRPTVLGVLPPSSLQSNGNFAKSKILADMHPISSTSFSSNNLESSFKPGMGYKYQIFNTQPKHGDVHVPVGAILLLPENSDNEKLPLIVVPHGGPHTCMSTSFFPTYGFLCNHGRYAILHVNFRGSTGFGQAALESLAGNIGSLDVLDVVAATHAAIDLGAIDPDRVGICGGSHGEVFLLVSIYHDFCSR